MVVQDVHQPSASLRGLDLQFSRDEWEVFAASTKMVVGDKTSALFWEDCWLDSRTISKIAPESLLLFQGARGSGGEAMTDRRCISNTRGALGPLAIWQYV